MEAAAKIENLLADPPPASSGRDLLAEVNALKADVAQEQAEQWRGYNEIATKLSHAKYQPEFDDADNDYLQQVQDIDHELLTRPGGV